jgi:kynureninase
MTHRQPQPPQTSPERVASTWDLSPQYAAALDRADPLAGYREQFHVPKACDVGGDPSDTNHCVYLTGNSLGLQPKSTTAAVLSQLEDWARLGVEGHLRGRDPWYPCHESLRGPLSRIVGAQPHEVVAMNTLTVNLHLLMLSFYRPTQMRYKIIIEGSAFPSDSYAVATQAAYKGFGPDAVVRLLPRDGEDYLRTEDILATIDRERESLALVMLGGVNYLTGQWFDMNTITAAAHKAGAVCGWDLAHAVGNVPLSLHDWNADFAVWCSYKYLNSGPGAVAGAYVHERHCRDVTLPQLAGWWGNDPSSRFEMKPDFVPVANADRFAMSNPPILALAPVKASLTIFDNAGIQNLRRKSVALTGYMQFLLEHLAPHVDITTPTEENARGCQLSLRLPHPGKSTLQALEHEGIVCDFRSPNIIRAAPTPLYNSFTDVHRFVTALGKVTSG